MRRAERGTSGLGLDQEWQIDSGNWRRLGRRVAIGESNCRERRLNKSRRARGDEIKCRCGMMRRFGRHKVLAARKRAFAAIVCIGRGNAFALFAAIRGFLRERPAAEAVERLEEQENCYDANRNVNATTHPFV